MPAAYGDCPVCRVSIRVTQNGLIFRHERWNRGQRRYLVCDGTGKPARPLDRQRETRARN